MAAAAAVAGGADWAVDWAEVSEGHNLAGRAAVMAEERALSPEDQSWVHPPFRHMHETIRRQGSAVASELSSAARLAQRLAPMWVRLSAQRMGQQKGPRMG